MQLQCTGFLTFNNEKIACTTLFKITKKPFKKLTNYYSKFFVKHKILIDKTQGVKRTYDNLFLISLGLLLQSKIAKI